MKKATSKDAMANNTKNRTTKSNENTKKTITQKYHIIKNSEETVIRHTTGSAPCLYQHTEAI